VWNIEAFACHCLSSVMHTLLSKIKLMEDETDGWGRGDKDLIRKLIVCVCNQASAEIL
jgi:hypothetical protein